jgi:hypothetical protein
MEGRNAGFPTSAGADARRSPDPTARSGTTYLSTASLFAETKVDNRGYDVYQRSPQ